MFQFADSQSILHPNLRSGQEIKALSVFLTVIELHLPIHLVSVLIDTTRSMTYHLLQGNVQATSFLRILQAIIEGN